MQQNDPKPMTKKELFDLMPLDRKGVWCFTTTEVNWLMDKWSREIAEQEKAPLLARIKELEGYLENATWGKKHD